MTAFYIAEDVTQLWFRLSTGADGVRIDDPALVEGEEAEGELLELGGELAAPEGLGMRDRRTVAHLLVGCRAQRQELRLRTVYETGRAGWPKGRRR